MNRVIGKFFLGTSGYQYNHWRDVFYPPRLSKSRWFAHYAAHFDTVEINNTFYRLPQVETFAAWREQTPPGFRYAVKFSRFGTHMKKLMDPEQSIGLFLERSEPLTPLVEAVLVQLPPRWRVDRPRLDAFLAAAPPNLRWAIEFRDPSWLCDEVYQLLESHQAALCIHDLIDNHPWRLTTDWTYVRFHGADAARPYSGDYSEAALATAAVRITALLQNGKDVLAYFNNDVCGFAVKNAKRLRELVANRIGASTSKDIGLAHLHVE